MRFQFDFNRCSISVSNSDPEINLEVGGSCTFFYRYALRRGVDYLGGNGAAESLPRLCARRPGLQLVSEPVSMPVKSRGGTICRGAKSM